MVFDWFKGKTNRPNKPSTGEGTSPPGKSAASDGKIENAVALASGIEMIDAFYPGHDPIDYYGNGGFRFSNMSHQGALLFLPSGIRRWDITSPEAINLDTFDHIFRECDDIELVLVGTGEQMLPIPGELRQSIRERGMKLDVMDTGAAVRTLNILLSEGRAVAAALLPVD